MLFFIGGLYGMLGGGLVGLTLDSSKKKKVKWGALIAEMTAGAIIVHMFLIEQIGFRMTPPRGDYWAICLGAGLALIWYMARNKHFAPLRVTFYSAIGGGFGFAFGTFFHLVMNWIELPFNTWNMAEYSIGFFGGIGMAYGVFSSKWEEELPAPAKWEIISAMLLIVIFIPVIIFRESFSYKSFIEKFQESANTEAIALANTVGALSIILIMIVSIWIMLAKVNYMPGRKEALRILLIYSVAYTLLSYISTGAFAGMFHSNHHLYFVNIAVVVWLLGKNYPAFLDLKSEKIETKQWIVFVIAILVSIVIMSFLSIEVHGPTPPRYDRFLFSN
ncbi:MAG: photosystem II biosynthesis protein, partial [Draconibacterium sp.]|nr:photosystem II biosynthesis protein [Draconibacterium sp.]